MRLVLPPYVCPLKSILPLGLAAVLLAGATDDGGPTYGDYLHHAPNATRRQYIENTVMTAARQDMQHNLDTRPLTPEGEADGKILNSHTLATARTVIQIGLHSRLDADSADLQIADAYRRLETVRRAHLRVIALDQKNIAANYTISCDKTVADNIADLSARLEDAPSAGTYLFVATPPGEPAVSSRPTIIHKTPKRTPAKRRHPH